MLGPEDNHPSSGGAEFESPLWKLKSFTVKRAKVEVGLVLELQLGLGLGLKLGLKSG